MLLQTLLKKGHKEITIIVDDQPVANNDIYRNKLSHSLHSHYIDDVDKWRFAPAVSNEGDNMEYPNPLLERAHVFNYDADKAELHVPERSTYIMDMEDSGELADVMLSCAMDNNGRATLVIDDYNAKTYNNNAATALDRYNVACNTLMRSQGNAPLYKASTNAMRYI